MVAPGGYSGSIIGDETKAVLQGTDSGGLLSLYAHGSAGVGKAVLSSGIDITGLSLYSDDRYLVITSDDPGSIPTGR